MSNNIAAVLADVRKAVIAGDYAQLVSLLPVLGQYESDVEAYDVTALRALREEAARAATCLESALSGVRAARRRIAEIAHADQGLTTYDRDGLKATVPIVVPVSRRV